MICLTPSVNLVRETNIDFVLLSKIISTLLPLKGKIKLHVVKTSKSYSFFSQSDKQIGISTTEPLTLRYMVSTILHEVRHAMQVKHCGKSLLFSYSSYNQYYNSPEEKDARKFEKLTTDVCVIYKSYKSIEGKVKKYNLDSFMELSENN